MIHIYSGDGKGKTSAAVGLALRGAGAGLRVCFYQFLKDGSSSEIAMLRAAAGISVICCEVCSKFVFQMSEAEKAAVTARHNEMLEQAKETVRSGGADMIVLDELFGAYSEGMLDRSAAEEIVRSCPVSTELVLTGRDPAEFFCERADYHSEIRSVRNPYDKGVKARKGIEY
ncbi:MAG: cob(I)yrinic acid a,c-diamide adenosyltransferase [Ruminococcus sp.]|nr:cob(I)yrinic acid a,c-diamide adenosyltransferase [Ruminococcus sp.]